MCRWLDSSFDNRHFRFSAVTVSPWHSLLEHSRVNSRLPVSVCYRMSHHCTDVDIANWECVAAVTAAFAFPEFILTVAEE